MSVRDPLGALMVCPQSLVAIFSLWRAVFELDGASAARALAFGLILIIGMMATLAYRIRVRHVRTERERALESRSNDLQRQLLALTKEIRMIREDVDSRLVVQEWQRAFNRVATRGGRRALRLACTEEIC